MNHGVKITVYSKKGSHAIDYFFSFEDLDRFRDPGAPLLYQIEQMRRQLPADDQDNSIGTEPDCWDFSAHPTP